MRETPLKLESNAKVSVKPHNICLVPGLFPPPPHPPYTLHPFPLLSGKPVGGAGTTHQPPYQGLYSTLFGVVMIHHVGSFVDDVNW